MFSPMLLYAYIVLLLCITLVATVARWRRRLMPERERVLLMQRYVTHIINALLEHRDVTIVVEGRARRKLLLRAIYLVVSHSYATDFSLLRDAVERNHLDTLVLRRIRLSRGVRRAKWLLWASALPLPRRDVHSLRRYAHSGDKIVRTSALLAMLSAQPSRAMQIISTLHYSLSPFDIRRVVALLRRGVLPVAYEPLLLSHNTNLRRLGLAIVRSFGIDIAERHLQNIATSARNPMLVRETLYTLSSLGCPLGRAKIRRRIEALSPRERGELCRYLGVEGYSLSALRTLFSEQELSRTEPLISSYKRNLVCT